MNTIRLNSLRVFTLLFFGIFLSGCATTDNPVDPLESMNRSVFSFNESLDENIVKPLADGYSNVTPDFLQKMVGNFYSNMDDVGVIFNELLQLKFREAGSVTVRFLINTTLGFAGLINYGEDYGFPKRNEDFGQTLGYYGVGSGPYIVFPIFGGFNLRQAAGGLVDLGTNPIFYTGFISAGIGPAMGALTAIDTRAQLSEEEEIINEAALDKYEFIRDAYLQRRRSLIYDGNPPRTMDYDIEESGQDASAPTEKQRSIVVEYIDEEDQDESTDDTAVEPETP